jgi:hypothetical protein
LGIACPAPPAPGWFKSREVIPGENRKAGRRVLLELEAEMLDIKGDCCFNIVDDVADTHCHARVLK